MSKSRKGGVTYQELVKRGRKDNKKTMAQIGAEWRAMKKASGGSKTAKKPASTKKSAPVRKQVAKKSTPARSQYYGIGPKPKGSVYGKPPGALKAKQVRRYGEYEVPHRLMNQYLVDHGMKPIWKKGKALRKKNK